jgi:STE24 endopeptidase
LQIAILAYFWRSGLAALLRDGLRRTVRLEFFVRFAFGGALALLARTLTLVPEFYLYRVERIMGVSDEAFPVWLGDWLIDTLFAIVIAGLIAAFVLWLADRTHQWYLITIAGVLAACLAFAYVAPILVAPIFNHLELLRGATATRLQALTARAGFAGIPIEVMDRSRRTQTEAVTLTGLGPSRRIVLSDTGLAAANPGELDFLTARALGHAAVEDDLRRPLVEALIVILGAALAVFGADRIGFRRDDDPVSRLALVGALLACAYVVAEPVYNAIDSGFKAQADAYAVHLTGDRPDDVRAFVRLADQRLLGVCPGFFARWYLQGAPSISSRIEQINGVQPPCR